MDTNVQAMECAGGGPGRRGRPPLKEFDSEAVLQQMLDTVREVYREKQEIKATADELELAPLKVKKLLITAGCLHYPETERILQLKQEGKTQEQIEELMGLGRASINSYLPYCRTPYKGELSQNAERVRRYKERKAAVETLGKTKTEAALWSCLELFQGYQFFTSSGLPFVYTLKRGRNGQYTKELFVDRMAESKSLSWSSVLLAFRRAQEHPEEVVKRPKALGDIRGISYVYSILWRFGLIQVPDKSAVRMAGRAEEPVKQKKIGKDEKAVQNQKKTDKTEESALNDTRMDRVEGPDENNNKIEETGELQVSG